MFKALGIAVGLYAAYAAARGSVYAKSGAWGRSITRASSPRYFWTVIAVYAGVSAALLIVF